MDHTICHFEIPADDLSRRGRLLTGASFGCGTSGAPATRRRSGWRPRCPPTRRAEAGASERERDALSRSSIPSIRSPITFSWEDIDVFAKKAEEFQGGVIAMPKTAVPGWGWFPYFKDPEGNIMGHVASQTRSCRVTVRRAGRRE